MANLPTNARCALCGSRTAAVSSALGHTRLGCLRGSSTQRGSRLGVTGGESNYLRCLLRRPATTRNNNGTSCLSTASCGAAIGSRRGTRGSLDFNIPKLFQPAFFRLLPFLWLSFPFESRRRFYCGARRQCLRFHGLPVFTLFTLIVRTICN